MNIIINTNNNIYKKKKYYCEKENVQHIVFHCIYIVIFRYHDELDCI